MPLLEHLVELRRRLMWSIGRVPGGVLRLLLFLERRSTSFLAEPLADVAGAKPGSNRTHDLHAALRGVLHLPQGGVLRRRVHRVPDHRDPDLAVRRTRPVSQREARDRCRSWWRRRCCSWWVPRWRTTSCSRSPGASSSASRRRQAAAACRSSCMPRVGEYLDLVMKLIFAFGITFQLAGGADAAGEGRHHHLDGAEALPALCVCRDVRHRRRSWRRPTSSPRPASRCR